MNVNHIPFKYYILIITLHQFDTSKIFLNYNIKYHQVSHCQLAEKLHSNYFITKYKKQLIVIVQNNTITQNNTKRILIVDDKPDIGVVLKMVLENNGYLVDYYYNPITILHDFKSNFYDLVLDI